MDEWKPPGFEKLSSGDSGGVGVIFLITSIVILIATFAITIPSCGVDPIFVMLILLITFGVILRL